eukprot:gene4945-5744_t
MTSTLNPRKLVRAETRDSVIHSYHDEEKQGLVEHLNFLLQDDQQLKSRIPIDPKSDLIFDSLKDGIILCKLINSIKPGTVNEQQVRMSAKLNLFEMNDNLDMCLKAARTIGCSIINIGPVDFHEGKRHLILSILWQLVKIDLMSKVTRLATRVRAEILDLSTKETVEDLVADEILVRWVNHQLGCAGSKRIVTNFSSDIRDCEVYIVLLHQLAPSSCSLAALEIADLGQRASRFLESADRIDCRKFITADDIVGGNGRLNIAFVAYIFNKFNQVAEEPPAVVREATGADTGAEVEREITAYQQRYHTMETRIEEIKVQDKEVEAKFEAKVAVYKQELIVQREEYEDQIQRLEAELARLEETRLPSVDDLAEELAHAAAEVAKLKNDVLESAVQEQQQVKAQIDQSSKILEEVRKETELKRAAIANETQVLAQEQAQLQERVDATGLTETKRKLEEVREQAKNVEASIKELKVTEKELKVTLSDVKEDRARIAAAKKKVQAQLDTAKDSTTKVIRTRIETDRIIDKTTRNIKDLKLEVDRIKNDTVYTRQQTEVIKVETSEVEEMLDDARVEKKRLDVKREEIREELQEREVELDEVLLDQVERTEEKKKEHREVLAKMKRMFDSDKKEGIEERQVLSTQVVFAQTELQREEFATEMALREAENAQARNRMFAQDVRLQAAEKQAFEEVTAKMDREKERTEKAAEDERKMNQVLEERNIALLERKAALRDNLQAASIEAAKVAKESDDMESKLEAVANELDESLNATSKLELARIQEAADLDIKMSEVKEERRRLKKLATDKKDEEDKKKQALDEHLGRDLIKLRTAEEMRVKDIQDAEVEAEDIDLKQQRLEEKLARTRKDIGGKAERLRSAAADVAKSDEKKKKLESELSKAMGMIERKSGDDQDRDYELAAMRLKKLKEASGGKSKADAEAAKKDLEARLRSIKSQLGDKEAEVKRTREETDRNMKLELEKLKEQNAKELAKSREKLERQLNETEEEFIKRRESQITKLNESNAKLQKEMERLSLRRKEEQEEEALLAEKQARRLERQRMKKLKEEKLNAAIQDAEDDGASQAQPITTTSSTE